MGVINNTPSINSKRIGLIRQRATKLVCKLHAPSVQRAREFISARRTIGNKNRHDSQVLEPGAFGNPPLASSISSSFVVEGNRYL
eukprot:726930-Pelagomonas_calceolata.AAC.1